LINESAEMEIEED